MLLPLSVALDGMGVAACGGAVSAAPVFAGVSVDTSASWSAANPHAPGFGFDCKDRQPPCSQCFDPLHELVLGIGEVQMWR